MYDIHSHVLPFIDDGAKTIEESLQMLSSAIENGVTHLVCTPHYRQPYLIKKEELVDNFKQFVKLVEEHDIKVKLFLGQEIKIDDKSQKMIENGDLLTLNASKYVLCEFSFADDDDISEECYRLSKRGFIPIVAHVERYPYVTDVYDIQEIKESGALVQINAESVLGKCGGWVKKFVFKLIKEGLVDFVASDAHFYRDNCLSLAYKKIAKKFGEEVAENLFVNNAKKIIV